MTAKRQAGNQPIADDVLLATIEAYRKSGTQEQAAALLGVAQQTVSNRLVEAAKRWPDVDLTPYVGGTADGHATIVQALPEEGKVDRYLFTCAQNYTKLHLPTWTNLKALAEHLGAHIVVSTLRYSKSAMGQEANSKRVKTDAEIDIEFPAEIRDFISNDRVRFETGDVKAALEFCGHTNIIPTARRPLSGMEDFTGRRSTILPHPTIALKSVGSLKTEGTKLLFTTGTVTERNYIQRKEGFRAEHYHGYGALLVEIDHTGSWWCRHVLQGPDGTMWDRDICVSYGTVETGCRVEAITWGDLHATQADKAALDACFGKGGVLDTLQPKEQFLHDVIDFECRSHHRRKDRFEMWRLYSQGKDSVEEELQSTATIVGTTLRPWVNTVIVNSNHDRHMERWVAETNPIDERHPDYVNFKVHRELEMALAVANEQGWTATDKPESRFSLLEFALQVRGVPKEVTFLREDQSYIILKRSGGGIECGLHGDRGVNGSHGSPGAFARMGRRINIGDKHTAEIMDGVYVAGTMTKRDVVWNKGPNSWSQSFIVTYPNATRSIFTVWRGKPWA